MWRSGLTCGFCYVDIEGQKYWMYTNSEIATETEFGRVKITNDIQGVDEADKSSTAVSVTAAEQIINSRPVSSLTYEGISGNESNNRMGTLTFTDSAGIQQEPINLYTPKVEVNISNTSDLVNDGEKDGNGLPFITSNVSTAITFTGEDNGIVFYDSENRESYPMYEPVDENGDTYIQSLGDLDVYVPSNINITANDCILESGRLILNDSIYFNLDLEVDDEQDIVTGGADKDFYLALRDLDWDLDFL